MDLNKKSIEDLLQIVFVAIDPIRAETSPPCPQKAWLLFKSKGATDLAAPGIMIQSYPTVPTPPVPYPQQLFPSCKT